MKSTTMNHNAWNYSNAKSKPPKSDQVINTEANRPVVSSVKTTDKVHWTNYNPWEAILDEHLTANLHPWRTTKPVAKGYKY